MKLEFALVFADMQRDLETACSAGATRKADEKKRLKTSTDEQLRHAAPKVVTSSTANLEDIAKPEKITPGAI